MPGVNGREANAGYAFSNTWGTPASVTRGILLQSTDGLDAKPIIVDDDAFNVDFQGDGEPGDFAPISQELPMTLRYEDIPPWIAAACGSVAAPVVVSSLVADSLIAYQHNITLAAELTKFITLAVDEVQYVLEVPTAKIRGFQIRVGDGGVMMCNFAITGNKSTYTSTVNTNSTVGGVAVSGSRCFAGDMTDMFGEWVPDALLDRLFAVFALRSDVTWQILTKRAERMHRYFDTRVTRHIIAAAAKDLPGGKADGWMGKCDHDVCNCQWPLPNVWLGVSCEDQQRADERIPLLLQTPAAIRFVSYEPALEYVNFRRWIDSLDWIIFGLESGQKARSGDADWGRDLIHACAGAKARPFIKQLGAQPFDSARTASGRSELLLLTDRKGGDPAEWPADLRVREMPRVEVPA